MGDNRDDSLDSRFSARPKAAIGFVPVENLVGRALVTFWSTDGSAPTGSSRGPGSPRCAADRIGNGFNGDDR